jgi:serine-type D-Ala-D-Ala carboxypeptidase/endopeptidase (penicillin-binding protein 4)
LVVRAHQARGRGAVAPPTILSGSGLTPENKLSADDLVAVLEHQYLSPHTFPVFYGGLVVPGDSPARSLRSRDSRWQSRVAVKTGTLTEPHSAFGLAGYIRKRDGGWMAFAAIVNGTEKRRNIPMREALQAIQTDVNRLMTQY